MISMQHLSLVTITINDIVQLSLSVIMLTKITPKYNEFSFAFGKISPTIYVIYAMIKTYLFYVSQGLPKVLCHLHLWSSLKNCHDF